MAIIGLALNEKAQSLKEPPQVATQRDRRLSLTELGLFLFCLFSFRERIRMTGPQNLHKQPKIFLTLLLQKMQQINAFMRMNGDTKAIS